MEIIEHTDLFILNRFAKGKFNSPRLHQNKKPFGFFILAKNTKIFRSPSCFTKTALPDSSFGETAKGKCLLY